MNAPSQSDFDSNDSPWWHHRTRSFPVETLTEDISADIVIVGAGLTGLSSAWQFHEQFPEKSIVILEATEIAHGASGRNGGLALNWFDEMDVRTPEYAREIYGITQETLQWLHDRSNDTGLPESHRTIRCANLYTSPASFAEAAKKAEKAQAAGIEVDILSEEGLAEELSIKHVSGAIVDPRAGQLDGVGFLYALASALQEKGVRIFENTAVHSIEESLPVLLRTATARVHAEAVVLATNAYASKLGFFKDKVIPLHSYVIATEAQSKETWESLGFRGIEGFSDDRNRLSYGCINRFGELVFGGGSNASYFYGYGGQTALHQRKTRSFDAVRDILLHYYPQLSSLSIQYRWSGPVAISLDRRCMMGVRGEHRNVFYALGFSGHGITMATLAGRVLKDLYCEDTKRWEHLPFFMRKGFSFPPEPFRWIGYKGFTTLTGKSPRKHVDH